MLQIPWNTGTLLIPLKKEVTVTKLEPAYPRPLDPSAIKNLIAKDFMLLATDIKKAAQAVLIIEDPSRSSKTRLLTELIINKISEIRGGLNGFTTVMASGAHFHIRPADLRPKIIPHGCQFFIHDCKNQAGLLKAGTSKSGIPLIFNKTVVQSDLRLSVSTMNIHPLVGFSGGGKILLPGVAGLETIESFHALAPGTPGQADSALRDLINETLGYLPIRYSWHLLSRPDGAIVAIHSGPISGSFARAKSDLLKLVTLKKPEPPVQMLLMGCRPFQQNLIGLFKSLPQIPAVLAPGGKVILFTEAPQGIGSHHWRTEPKVVEAQKKHYQELLKDYQVAIYSPDTKLAEFRSIIPEKFILLKSKVELIEFINHPENAELTVVPYAPVTLFV